VSAIGTTLGRVAARTGVALTSCARDSLIHGAERQARMLVRS